MNYEEDVQKLNFNLLNEVLSKGIERNEEQRKIWTDYKNGHLKVEEALKIFPRDLSVDCMVPLGKRALMRGKLIHTNEVLASLGGEYFAKYSASGAMALCERRIAKADEMLKTLGVERDFFESRMMVPGNPIFEECAGEDVTEHWNEEQVDEWRKKHREREKEYRQKLAKIQQEERKKIETEEDLFHRLDQLEIEEELADELNRLKDEGYEFDENELEEGECYYEEEDTSESEEDESEHESETPIDSGGKQSKENIEKNKKSVSFAGPENDTTNEERRNLDKKVETNELAKDTEEDVLRIEFSHSQSESDLKQCGETIETPSDIYRLFSKPRSILKRSPNDIPPQQIAPLHISSEEEEEEADCVKPSTYEIVVKDIRERDTKSSTDTLPIQTEQRPVSKFKRERGVKN